MIAQAETFKALGDPVRLEMVLRLSSGAPHTITTLSSGLGITRQGARRHLHVLAGAHVVRLVPKGRETQVSLDREVLDAARLFIQEMERRWDHRLEALRELVEGESEIRP